MKFLTRTVVSDKEVVSLADEQDISGKENTSNKENTTIDSSVSKYPTVNLLNTGLGTRKPYHGIQTAGALSFDNSSHVLTIASGTNTYWFQGTKYTTSSAITCDLDLTADRDNSTNTLATNKIYFFYFKDTTGKLYWSDTPWNFASHVFVATLFWNGSAGALQSEKHNYTRNIEWHIWAHTTIGARYGSGLSLTLPTTGTPGSLEIESGSVYDEDLLVTIGEQTTLRGWYKASASIFTFADFSLPYIGTTGQPQYLDTGTYSLVNVDSAKYSCYWLYASNDIAKPIYCVPTHSNGTNYNTIALARAETPPNLSNLGLNPEMKLIYKFIYKGDGNFQESVDYRTSSPLPGGGSSSTTASAVSFTPSGTIASTTVQTAIEELDTEKQVVLTSGTNIKTINSNSLLGSGDLAITGVTYASAAEVTAGTENAKAVSPDNLAGSTNFGVKTVQIQVVSDLTDVDTTTGIGYFYVPQSMNGMNLLRATAMVATAGTTNATTIQIRNLTKYASNDALSTAISIASAGTVATAGTVNASYDDVSTNDKIKVYVTAQSTTKPKGLYVVLEYQLP